MLEITVAAEESFDEDTGKFFTSLGRRVILEHSLVSMSKWESLWEKPFLSTTRMSTQETLSYVELMILDRRTPPEILQKLYENHLEKILEYVKAPMSATKLPEPTKAAGSREVITAELIYYWMISMQIPMECQYWHLNRLLTLIRLINFKNDPKKSKKMSLDRRRELNAERRAKFNTRG